MTSRMARPWGRNGGLVVAGVLIAAATAAAADDGPKQTPAQIVDAAYPQLEQLYLTLHRNPELSLAEAQTAKRLVEPLRADGYAVTENVGGHGIVAVMQNGPGPVLMIRTDLDALPVKENTGAEYASTATTTDADGKTVNVMHACGHDVHMTCLVGVAGTMAKLKDRWSGTLVLIGQPAEEVGKGAKAMLDDGLFKRFPRPNYVLGLHVDPELESGKVGYVSGFALANVDSVDVVIRGVGGHGAYPHKTKDPIVIAAQFVLALQTIASREIRPIDAVVVTVGSIHGGTKHNVIPDEVTLQLTVRTYEDSVREQTLSAIERIAMGTAKAAGVPDDRMPVVTRRDAEFTPALYNTPELVSRVIEVFRGAIGERNVVERKPEMGGEDFARYGREEPKIPIFMYRLGSIPPTRFAESQRPGARPLPSLHSAVYLPDRVPTIKTGVVTMTAAALELLKPTK